MVASTRNRAAVKYTILVKHILTDAMTKMISRLFCFYEDDERGLLVSVSHVDSIILNLRYVFILSGIALPYIYLHYNLFLLIS